jgi:hypothetical protein
LSATLDSEEMTLEDIASVPFPMVGNMKRLKLLLKERKGE